MTAAGSYLILIPFGSYFEGQFAVLDAATATKYAADIVPVGGVTSTAAPVSTAGTTASGTGNGTTTTAGSTVTVATVGSSVVITSTAADGSSTTGTVASISAAQTALLMNLQGILNSSNQVTATVIGPIDSATIGGVTGAALKAEADASKAAATAQSGSLTSLGGSLSAFGTLQASDHGAITALGTMSATAQTELNGLLNGTFSALSGDPTLSGSTISFPHANGTTSSLILPASTGTLAVPASAPALYSDSSGVLHPVAFVSTHIVSSNGSVDLSPSVLSSLGGVITGSSTSGTVTTVSLANGSNLVITGSQGATGATGAAGSLAAGSLINPARESTSYGGPSRLVSDIAADTFTAESWGATGADANGNCATIQQGIGATTRYAVTAYTNDLGAQPYACAATMVRSQQDDYPFWPSGASPTSGNTWNLATTFVTTSAGFPTPAVCNEDQNYYYIPLNKNYSPGAGDVNNLYQFFHSGMALSGGGLAAGTTIVSTMPTHLRVTPQASGFTLAQGVTITVCPDMTQFTVGKQVFSPQGLVPLSNITAVSGSTITLGTHTAPGTASSPASVASAQSNAFTGAGIPINQCCYVYTPVAEGSICSQTTMDTLADYAADQYTAVHGARVLQYGPKKYQIIGPLYSVGGNLSRRGAGSNKTTIFSNGQVQGSGLAAVFKNYPASGANIVIDGIGIGYYEGQFKTFWDFDGCGFMPAGPYSSSNLNAYSLNQINTAAITINGCSGTSNYSGGYGCLEMVRMEGCGYSFFDNNTWSPLGGVTPGSRALVFGRTLNIEMRHNLIFNCEWPIEQRNYAEHPIVEYLLLQSCAGAYTNRRASQFSFSSMFFGEFKGGDLSCTTTCYDIRDANEITITDFHGHANGATDNNPMIRLSGCLVAEADGYVDGTGNTVAAIQLSNSVRDGTATGSGAVRVFNFASDNTATTLLIDAGCGSTTYGNISHSNGLSAAVTDNSGNAVNLGGGSSSSGSLPADYADPASNFYFGQITQQNVGTVQTVVASTAAGSFAFWNSSTNVYTAPINGYYEMEAEVIFADTGTAAVTGPPAYNAAPAAGKRFMGVFVANGGVLISIPCTTQPTSTAGFFKWRAYLPTGTTLSFAMTGDVAGLIMNGTFSVRCIEKTT